MYTLAQTLSIRIKELTEIIRQAELDLTNTPKGNLRISKNKNSYEYFLITNPKDTKGQYIKKKDIELIQKLAQRTYAEKILKAANKEKSELQNLLNKYNIDHIQTFYDTLPKPRQNLIHPYIIPDEQYISRWQSAEYPIHYHPEEDNCIYTEKGEPVRSKSEKILADKFNTMNIPYHYEKPLYLKGFGTIHPDFTVLNKRTRQEYYWEHFGLMDNAEYCEKAIRKLESLAKNGILQGKNLILTYETSQHALNMRMVETLIHEYLV